MSLAQVAGTVATAGIVGALANEVMGNDRKPPAPDGQADQRSTSFSKGVGMGFGIVAGVSLMGAFTDAMKGPSAAPAPATPQLAATNTGPALQTPGLNPFANGPSFPAPGGMIG
ncbi:MAG: hypothetical protein H6862_05720 [Rhodospirillales bacterium]|nr:hypothetical protein [Rhodospirillales bacterium]